MAGIGMGSLALDQKHDGLGEDGAGFQDKGLTTGFVSDQSQYSGIRPQHRKMHDKDVTFQEYQYYAERTRAEEDSVQGTESVGILKILFPTKSGHGAGGEKNSAMGNISTPERRAHISDEEWTNVRKLIAFYKFLKACGWLTWYNRLLELYGQQPHLLCSTS